jgi:hypothetical protein
VEVKKIPKTFIKSYCRTIQYEYHDVTYDVKEYKSKKGYRIIVKDVETYLYSKPAEYVFYVDSLAYNLKKLMEERKENK